METRQWLLQVIRMRKKLIASDRSHKNAMSVTADLAFLERHLTANRYTGLTIAAFFIRHSDKIYNILPGEGSGSHVKLQREFMMLLDECLDTARKLDNHIHAPSVALKSIPGDEFPGNN